MAYLTKCSLCGRDVSSECSSCPGCGHNVARELQQKIQWEYKEWNPGTSIRYGQRVDNSDGVLVDDKLNALAKEGWEVHSWTTRRLGMTDREDTKYFLRRQVQ